MTTEGIRKRGAHKIRVGAQIRLKLRTAEVAPTKEESKDISMLSLEELDDRDKTILEILRNDSRTPISKIAKTVNLTRTPCLYRVRRLQHLRYIMQYTIIGKMDAGKYSPKKFMLISLAKTDEDVIENLRLCLNSNKCVIWAGLSEGIYDFIAIIDVDNDEAFRQLLREIRRVEGVKNTRTFSIVDEIVKMR